jgi:glyoxylase-like metal-dependent hydrolase (beta-lactamase superfamily II)
VPFSSRFPASLFLFVCFSDLLIDTGVGLFSLSAYLTASGLRADPDKPLKVVLTHLHFDHTGGAHQFQQVGMPLTSSSR